MSASILAPYNTIYVTRGSNKTLSLTITDASGSVLDLTNSTVIFTVKAAVTDTLNMFQKSTTSATQALITKPRAGAVSIFIDYKDTQYREPGEYVYDVWVVDSANERFCVIEPAPFVIQPSVTFLP